MPNGTERRQFKRTMCGTTLSAGATQRVSACSSAVKNFGNEFYVEMDIKSFHPTMLCTRLARLGKRIRLLDDWAEDKEASAERISQETAGMFGIQPQAAAIEDLILAAINGASVEKWVSSKWGSSHAPSILASFARELATVRANAHN